MGWDSTYTSMTKNGKVDVKGFLDNEFTWENESGRKNTVIKSSMVGSTYYAAVRAEYPDKEEPEVFALICHTKTGIYNGCNIHFKSMSEDMGPVNYDCPVGILKLLTPTESDEAKKWRISCYEHIEAKKRKKNDPYSLKNLPVGSQIRFTINFSTSSGLRPGDNVILSKCEKLYLTWKDGQRIGKTKTYWSDGYYRWSEKMIPEGYSVISVNAA